MTIKNTAIHFASAEENPQFEGVLDISPEELQTLWTENQNENRDTLQLIDVRELEEFHGELGHIQGAQLISLGHLPEVLPEHDRNKTYVFICRSGGRSGRAAAFARSAGFHHIYNMKGGMLFWNELHLPTTTE